VIVRRLGALVIVFVLTGCPGFRASAPPERVLEPELLGVVTDWTTVPGSDERIYVLENGTEVSSEGETIWLTGLGPAEDRLLLVAHEGDTTYLLTLPRAEEMTSAPDCYAISQGAWLRDRDILFGFPEHDVALRLPAAPSYDPRAQTEEDHGYIIGVVGDDPHCVTPEGIVYPAR
jgi:hypothetical protein